MSPETISSVFPDRLIHPLPKRRLRERLSPDVADSIKYPPAQVSGTPLFYYPYNLKDDAAPTERTIVVGRANLAASTTKPTTTAATAASATAVVGTETAANQTTRLPSRTRRNSEEHGPPSSSRVVRLVSRSARPAPILHTPPPESHQTVPSTASSVDGYESFENTNNKKKRKIPTAGDTPHGGSYASTDLHSATSGSSTTNSNDDSLAGSPLSTNSGPASFVSASSGISGPGRGRYGRSRSGRIPLHPLTDAGNNWAGRYGKLRPPWPMQPERDLVLTAAGNAGIISSAIAKAEKQSSRGQENTGLTTQDQQSAASTPVSAQFTFTCSSQVPGNLTWPGSDPKIPPSSSYWQQGRLRGGLGQPMSVRDSTRQGSSGSVASSAGGGSSGGVDGGRMKQQGKKKKGRSKISQELDKQARDRRRSQQHQNAASPPTGDIYMCPFCEYENITGYKPRILIQEFEMKERKKRLDAERRQREQRAKDKSKGRNRKGRKASKSGTASGSSARQGSLTDSQQYDGPSDDLGQGVLGEDIYEDDDGAGEVDDVVAELRSGIGDAHNLRARGRDGEGMQATPAGG